MDILNKLQEIFRDVFDDETIVLTNETTQDDIEDWEYNCSNKKRF